MSLWNRMGRIRKAARKIDWLYIPYRTVKMALIDGKRSRALKKDGISVIEEVNRTLSATDFLFFVDFGTMLGAVRSRDFISWDMDIDYGVVIEGQEDWQRFAAVMEAAGFRKIRQFLYDGNITEQTYRKRDVTVDFFAHREQEDCSLVYDYLHREDYPYAEDNFYHVRENRYAPITSIQPWMLAGTEIRIPGNAEEYLASVYGENWRVPNPQWQSEDCCNGTLVSDRGEAQSFRGNY